MSALHFWSTRCHTFVIAVVERYGQIMHGFLDLNIDMGESLEGWQHGSDRQLLAVATSVNVCTGAYAGTTRLITETVEEAVTHRIRIGAQVGYRDREGFGRRPQEISTRDLHQEIAEQLDALTSITANVGGEISYVKPHGALYHRVHHDPAQAEGLLSAIQEHNPRLAVMGMPQALTLDLARTFGLHTITEGFADRGYTEAGLLISRDQPGALIGTAELAADQALRLAHSVESLCVHSDSPGALDLITHVREALEANDITVGYRT